MKTINNNKLVIIINRGSMYAVRGEQVQKVNSESALWLKAAQGLVIFGKLDSISFGFVRNCCRFNPNICTYFNSEDWQVRQHQAPLHCQLAVKAYCKAIVTSNFGEVQRELDQPKLIVIDSAHNSVKVKEGNRVKELDLNLEELSRLEGKKLWVSEERPDWDEIKSLNIGYVRWVTTAPKWAKSN